LSAVEVPVYRRDAMRVGQTFAGPLVIVEPTSTTYVQPGWRASADGYGNLIARAA
jgi:N-methylhydantoinase A/oxoprolinase/acetone carboxylase beta subunit